MKRPSNVSNANNNRTRTAPAPPPSGNSSSQLEESFQDQAIASTTPSLPEPEPLHHNYHRTLSTESAGRDVITILQQDDQELAAAKIRAKRPQQSARLTPSTTMTAARQPSNARQADNSSTDSTSQPRPQRPSNTRRPRQQRQRQQPQLPQQPRRRSTQQSQRRRSTQTRAPPENPATSLPTHNDDQMAKEKAKARANPSERGGQYASHDQAVATNLAFRTSQKDSSRFLDNMVLEEAAEGTENPASHVKQQADNNDDPMAKEKARARNARTTTVSEGGQYTSHDQAVATNLAFRTSQKDSSRFLEDMILEEAEGKGKSVEEETKEEEQAPGWEPEDAPEQHTDRDYKPSRNSSNNSNAPIPDESMPGAFRVGTSFVPAISSGDDSDEQEDSFQSDDDWEEEEEDPQDGVEFIVPTSTNRRHYEPTMDASEKSAPNDNNSQGGGDILVEATLVGDAEQIDVERGLSVPDRVIVPEPELVTAQRLSDTYQPSEMIKSKYGRRWILGGACCLVFAVAIIGIIFGIGWQRRQDEPPPTLAPTAAPTSFFDDVLPPYTQEAIMKNNTPQAKAHQWYLDDLKNQEDSFDPENPHQFASFVPLQRFVLATVYYSMAGDNWKKNTNWLNHNESECNWYTEFFGSICGTGPQQRRRELAAAAAAENEDGSHVRQRRHLQTTEEQPPPPKTYYNRLSLYKNNLVGTLPPEVSLLPFLDVVNLHGNPMTGPIPSELGLLEYVTLLQLFQNELTGTVPTELGQLKRIKQFNLGFNNLTGTIPSELGHLSSTVESVSVSNNLVTGVLPTELGYLTSCTALYFYKNRFLSGPLPTEVGTMTSLQVFQMNDANWTGTIPSELGLAKNLAEVYLDDNRFLEGTIPTEFNQLTQLSKLSLHNTQLTGSIPPALCNLMEAGTLEPISIDCERMTCPCNVPCDCEQSTEGDSEMVTQAPVVNDMGPNGTLTDPDGDELVTDPPIEEITEETSDPNDGAELITVPPGVFANFTDEDFIDNNNNQGTEHISNHTSNSTNDNTDDIFPLSSEEDWEEPSPPPELVEYERPVFATPPPEWFEEETQEPLTPPELVEPEQPDYATLLPVPPTPPPEWVEEEETQQPGSPPEMVEPDEPVPPPPPDDAQDEDPPPPELVSPPEQYNSTPEPMTPPPLPTQAADAAESDETTPPPPELVVGSATSEGGAPVIEVEAPPPSEYMDAENDETTPPPPELVYGSATSEGGAPVIEVEAPPPNESDVETKAPEMVESSDIHLDDPEEVFVEFFLNETVVPLEELIPEELIPPDGVGDERDGNIFDHS